MLRIASVLVAAIISLLPSHAAGQIAEIAKAQAADPLAPYVKASGWVSTGKDRVFVELLIDEKHAGLRLRTATNQTPEIRVLNSPSEVLKLLADKRMDFLAPALVEWAGATLEPMRDRQLMQLQAAAARGEAELPPSTTGESTSRPQVRALIQLASFLTEIGRSAEAERLLQERLATMQVKANGRRWNEIEWFTVAAWIATARKEREDVEGALAEYDLIGVTLGNSPYAMNAVINRAALLVRSKRYAEALAVIDPLWLKWSAFNSGDKVGGSERQFAWIRACALEGLGRHAEADDAFRPVLEATGTRDRDFVIDSDDELKLRGLVCMRRKAAVKAMIENEIRNDLSPGALLTFQPAFRPVHDAEFWADLRADPELSAIVRERMRELPPELTAALNGWR